MVASARSETHRIPGGLLRRPCSLSPSANRESVLPQRASCCSTRSIRAFTTIPLRSTPTASLESRASQPARFLGLHSARRLPHGLEGQAVQRTHRVTSIPRP